jgi:hypothetical protein
LIEFTCTVRVLTARCSVIRSKNPVRDFCYLNLHVRVSVCSSASVKWLVGPSSTSSTEQHDYKLFYLTLKKICAATEVAVQWQMHRTRGARVIKR